LGTPQSHEKKVILASDLSLAALSGESPGSKSESPLRPVFMSLEIPTQKTVRLLIFIRLLIDTSIFLGRLPSTIQAPRGCKNGA